MASNYNVACKKNINKKSNTIFSPDIKRKLKKRNLENTFYESSIVLTTKPWKDTLQNRDYKMAWWMDKHDKHN